MRHIANLALISYLARYNETRARVMECKANRFALHSQRTLEAFSESADVEVRRACIKLVHRHNDSALSFIRTSEAYAAKAEHLRVTYRALQRAC
ncbi:MAG: hypothetical protein V3S69_06445 [Dehalococcoidales bacterium]